jgi:WD40 repeat protein/serine/threonine protein kinase
MSTQFDNLKRIFLQAVEMESAAQRAAYLDQACAGNAHLRGRLEALLAADVISGAVLDRLPAGLAPTAGFEPILEQPGSVIGSYKLLQKIGEGGMGLVFMAEQLQPVKRKVALKIIKPGMDSKQVVARFEAERQVLALMNHPHIAQVFDAGETESGRPYFVMELVRGVPITEYCDQNNLTPRERLELFVPVCHAVQHAHQKGVIHRDIKPTNVLVTLHDGNPVPKVIDFGVAKAINQELTARTLFTNFAQMVGTPLYMSPEQAEMSGLDVDTRADIYSLGVLLYELLTGQTPFDGMRLREAAFDEIRRIIREEEPLRPSTRLSTLGDALTAVSSHRKTDPAKLSQLLRGDLDWIVMKSLEKDRTRRYETASEFAADIRRHLHDEPVVAGPPRITYRLRKFVRKHRGPVVAAVAVVAALALGLTGSLVLYARSERMRQAAVRAEAAANEARDAEEQRAAELQHALGDVTAEWNLKNDALAAKDAALQRSEALRLTTHSTNVLPQDPGLALILASEAARLGPRLAPVNNALLAALGECREVRTLVVRPPFSENEPEPLAVQAVSWSRDGSRVLTVAGGTIHQRVTLNTRTDLFGTFTGPETLRSTLRLDVGTAQIWEAASGRLLTTTHAPPTQRFATVELSPNGRLVAATFDKAELVKYSGGETHLYTDRVARIYDAGTGEERHILRGHTDHLVSASFSPDSRRVVTASWDKSARIWDLTTGEPVPDFQIASAASFETATYSPDGRQVLTLSSRMDSGKKFADDSEGSDPGRESWKIDPPPGRRELVRDTHLGEWGNWSRPWNAFGVPPAEAGARPGVHLWQAETGEAIPESSAEDNAVVGEGAVTARFSHDGVRIASGRRDGTVVVRAARDLKETCRFCPRKDALIRALDFSRDDSRLLLTYDDALAVCDSGTGDLVSETASRTSDLRLALFGDDGRQVFVVHSGESSPTPVSGPAHASNARTVSIVDAASFAASGALKGHAADVTAADVSPDGRQIVTASLDGTARIWDARRIPEIGTVSGRAGRPAPFLNRDGRLMLSADVEAYKRGEADGIASVIDAASGKLISTLVPTPPAESAFFKQGLGGLYSAQFSQDGKRLLTLSDDRRVRVIKPGTTGETLFTTNTDKWPIQEELPFAPVRVWDVATGRALFALSGLKYTVDWAALSPDGTRILTRSRPRESYCYVQPEQGNVVSSGHHFVSDPQALPIHVWDAADGRLLFTVRDTLNPTNAWESELAWGPDRHSFASSAISGWLDFANAKLATVPEIWSRDILTFSPNGKYLLSRNADRATVVEVSASRQAHGPHQRFELTSYSVDGRASVPSLQSESAGARLIPSAKSTSSIIAAAFSPDSRWLATTTADHTVEIREAGTGDVRHVLRGHLRNATLVAFSGDGRWLVTASDDRTARVWEVATGAEFVTLSGHGGPVRSAVFSSDGQSLVTSSTDGTARTWPTDPLKIAMPRKPRELTPEERARFEIDQPRQ